MRLQMFIISSFIATVLVILVLFTYYINVVAETNVHVSTSHGLSDIYDLIKTRINWTAREMCDALIERFGFSYVNVSISTYDILRDNRVVYTDKAVMRPVGKQVSVRATYVLTDLRRDGKYVEYLIEVGWD